MTTPYLQSRNHKISKWVFWGTIIIVLLFLLSGCAKNASESATDTSLNNLHVIQHKIDKECPRADFTAEIMALESSIKNQLAVCETEKGNLREKNNTLLAILIGLIALIVVKYWNKLKGLVR